MDWEELTDADLAAVEQQIGRKPRSVLGIARRCKFGQPLVVVNHPVEIEGEQVHIFPTLFWLTCPSLHRAVARLESAGIIAEFQERLQRDEDFLQAMQAAHREYAEARIGLVPAKTRIWLQNSFPRQYRALAKGGVGGIGEATGVKCLHAHYACYLAGMVNPVGEVVDAMLRDHGVDPAGTEGCWSGCP